MRISCSSIHNEMEGMMSGRNSWTKTASAFAVGLGVGAAVGILFAPRSGSDTRDLVVESAKDRLDGAIEAGGVLKERAQDSIEQIKGQVKKATEVGERAYREAKSSAS
jgi:gas vesicle protein